MDDIGCWLCHRHGVLRPATMYIDVRRGDPAYGTIHLVCDSHAQLYPREILFFLPVPDELCHLVAQWRPGTSELTHTQRVPGGVSVTEAKET
jgi:hypothetical protein